MSGHIANGRKGPCEATRYIYLHFGGLGIQFGAKSYTQYVGPKGYTTRTKSIPLKLSGSYSGAPNSPYFSAATESAYDEYSLCFPTLQPRVWINSDVAGKEKIVFVSGGAYGNISYIFYNNTKIHSKTGVVLSASVIEDAVFGECLFYVYCPTSTAFMTLAGYTAIWPLFGEVISVRTKAVVHSWTLKPEELGINEPLLYSSYYPGLTGQKFTMNGSHSRDGLRFRFTVYEYSKGMHVVTVTHRGVASVETVLNPKQVGWSGRTFTNGKSKGSSTASYSPGHEEHHHVGDNGPTELVIVSKIKGKNEVARYWDRSDKALRMYGEISTDSKSVFGTTNNQESHSTYDYSGGTGGYDGIPRVPLVEVRAGNIVDEQGYTKEAKAVYLTTITLWNGREVEMSRIVNAESNRLLITNNRVYRTVQVDGTTTSSTSTGELTITDVRVYTADHIERTAVAYNAADDMALFAVSRRADESTATYTRLARNSGYSDETMLYDVKGSTKYERWLELHTGDTVTTLLYESKEYTSRYETGLTNMTSLIPWNYSESFPYMRVFWEDSFSEGRAYESFGATFGFDLYYVITSGAYDIYQNATFYSKYVDLIKNGEASWISVPLVHRATMIWETTGARGTTVPDNTKYFIKLSPSGAEAGSATELTDRTTEFTKVVGVRPVV